MKYSMLILGVVATLLSFSGQADVIIDPAGVDKEVYEKDLAECKELSGQVESKAGSSAARGAVQGAAIGVIVGNNNRSTRRHAGVGAVLGGASGSNRTRAEQEKIIKNCMKGRGYNVLN
ncbi:MAG: glycine zipper family protein [Proteobacteria bacterium]|nr:glycine zipper family protein [Pseudomonadota bacterium]